MQAKHTVSTAEDPAPIDWIVTLRDPVVSEATIEQWEAWIAKPENKIAFDKAQHVWELMGDISLRVDRCSPPRQSGRYIRLGVTLAAITATIAIVFWLRISAEPNARRMPSAGTFATSPGQHRDVVLRDGSQIHLGARSAVATHFEGNVRFVILDQGEAIFDVAHDSSRFFRVYANGGVITALGTSFNVRRRHEQVTVTVRKGSVIVAPASAQTARSGGDLLHGKRLASGESISYTADGAMSEVTSVDPKVAMAWRNGQLEYRSEPLSRVVQDINRYSRRSIQIADEKAGAILYTGTVFERDIDYWVEALDTVFPELDVSQLDSGHVVVVRSR